MLNSLKSKPGAYSNTKFVGDLNPLLEYEQIQARKKRAREDYAARHSVNATKRARGEARSGDTIADSALNGAVDSVKAKSEVQTTSTAAEIYSNVNRAESTGGGGSGVTNKL